MAVPNFAENLERIRGFLREANPHSASQGCATLLADLRDLRQRLSWNPGSSRYARFMQTRSPQSRQRILRVQKLAKELGLPNVKEARVSDYVVLLTHSGDRVALLAIKHQRELLFRV